MSSKGTLQREVAASIEDVDRLLEQNAKLSLGYIAMRFNQYREQTNEAIEVLQCRVDDLERRMERASTAFSKMERQLKATQGEKHAASK